MGQQVNPNCGTMPATFFEALASALVTDADGNIFLNVICYNGECASLDPAIACGDNITDLEAYVVQNVFSVDVCGLPAIKLRVCVDADAENAEGRLL